MTARINHDLYYHLIKKRFILLGPTSGFRKSLHSGVCLALTQRTCATCPTSHTQGHPSTAYLHDPANACPHVHPLPRISTTPNTRLAGTRSDVLLPTAPWRHALHPNV
jgi:hypothetical protein